MNNEKQFDEYVVGFFINKCKCDDIQCDQHVLMEVTNKYKTYPIYWSASAQLLNVVAQKIAPDYGLIAEEPIHNPTPVDFVKNKVRNEIQREGIFRD